MTLFQTPNFAATLAARGGETGRMLASYDWATTPLGPIEVWPRSLKTVVDLMLGSRQPVYIAWGPECSSLYNDSYIPILGEKHPQALGRPFREVFAEIWDEYRPLIEATLSGEGQHFLDQPVALTGRSGLPLSWFNFSWTPLRDDTGQIAGFYCAAAETTEKVRAEQILLKGKEDAVRASEARYRKLLESIDEGFCVVEVLFDANNRPVDYRFVEANPAFERQTGLVGATGRTARELVPNLEPHWFEIYGRVALTGQPVRFENGSEAMGRWFDVHAQRVGPPADRRVAILFNDISARRRAEHALRASEERQAFLLRLGDEVRRLSDPEAVIATTTRALGERLDATRVAYAEVDDRAGIATVRGGWVNGNAGHLPERIRLADYGGDLIEHLRGGGTLRVTDAATHAVTRESYAALERIAARALVSVPLFKDGSFAINLNVHQDRPRKWSDAEVDLIEAVAERTREAVERARAEAARAESERELQLLADTLPVLVAYIDREHRYRFANRVYETWFSSLRREDIIGKRIPEVVGEAAYESVRPRIEAALAGEAVTFEQFMPYREGEHRYIRVDYVPRTDADGRVVGCYSLVQDITAAKRVEVALHESETRFRGMADHAPVMIWVTDPTGRCSYLNARWYEYTGQSPGSGEGYGWLEAVHPEDRSKAQEAFVSANSERRNYRVDFRLRRADGVYRWALDAAAARFGAEGECLGYVGSVIDIDERREMEDRLREVNEGLEERVAAALAERKLLADIVETTDAQVQALDVAYRWLAINNACADAYEHIYGKRPQIGDSLLELLADRPEELAAAKAVWDRALAGEAFTQVGEFGEPQLGRRFFEMKFEVLRGPDGAQIGAFLTGRDVTDRVREHRRLAEAEAARREADALYRTYFANTPEALFVIGIHSDDGFVVEEINPAHEAGVGLRAEDVRGRRIEDILPEHIARRVTETYREVAETGAILQYREVFDLTGEPQHWDTSLVPMRNDDGRVVRLIGSSRNLTRQVIAEEALRQSQKMEAMGQLTGGVAHDFNNLLTPIVGALDMLQRRGAGGARERRIIAGAAQSADRAKTLVQRLLAFARRQPLQATAVDVARLVTGMADLLTRATGPQIRVVVATPDDLPPAEADPNQLEMALLNLGVNARDAMPDGGTLRITVRAERVQGGHPSKLRAGDYIRLSVADTGMGMDDATLKRAVEPFFSTKGVGKGTGLGLSMVHGLASQLGGALTIDSRPGVGTNVELWLPQSAEPVETGETTPEPTAKPLIGKVLLVDDEELVRISTADMLADLGYSVVEAHSGEEALRLVEDGLRPDLLVTDHLMPGMNGTDLTRAIRARLPGIQVLIVSGYADVEGIAPDLPRLTKPFKNVDLVAALADGTRDNT